MPSAADRRKPHPLLAATVAASGLLLAALGRRPGEARQTAPAARTGVPGAAGSRDRPGPGGPTGRHADRPGEIPARGWWQILKRTAQQISDDRVMTEAAGVTFYALLALFPAIAAMISIYGLFAEPATIGRHLDAVSGFVPEGGMEIISEQVRRISEKGGGTLGLGALIGLATALWSANQAMKALVDALNVVYEEKEERGFFARLALTMAFTLGAILFVLLAIAAVVVLPVALGFVGLGGGTETVLRVARWPLMLLAIGLFLALVYRYGPSRERAKWRWVSWGSAVASVVWVGGSLLFSWYVASFGNYNETYGSLGAVIGFMTWIWLSAIVVLAGAELDAEMERQTARDTTTGPEKPMGTRGARMADTVAG
jgi:membrane protein